MSRGGQKDGRETFRIDSLQFRKKGSNPPAPGTGAFEFYFLEVPYFLDEAGRERAVGVSEKTPVSATSPGIKGQVCWDASYLYVCIADNTWKRVAIATW